MSQIYFKAKRLIELAKQSQPRLHDGKVIISVRESKDSVITLVGYINSDDLVSKTDITLIEQHYSGDDQLSVVKTDDDELIDYLNSQLLEVA